MRQQLVLCRAATSCSYFKGLVVTAGRAAGTMLMHSFAARNFARGPTALHGGHAMPVASGQDASVETVPILVVPPVSAHTHHTDQSALTLWAVALY